MSPENDVTPAELRRWLERVEKKVNTLDQDMRKEFAALNYVTLREYELNRNTEHAYNEETRSIATSARAWTWAMFAVVAVAMLGSLYAIIRSV